MPKTKAELQNDSAQYHTHRDHARHAIVAGEYHAALEWATSSLNYVDGMMRYERRYAGKDFHSVETIELILKYGPLLFHTQSLDSALETLNSNRQIVKNTTANLVERIEQAKARLFDLVRMWNLLERHGTVKQSELRAMLGGDQDEWRAIAEHWDELQVLNRTPQSGTYLLKLRTNLNEPMRGLCANCGNSLTARKESLFYPLTCSHCGTEGCFVIAPLPTSQSL